MLRIEGSVLELKVWWGLVASWGWRRVAQGWVGSVLCSAINLCCTLFSLLQRMGRKYFVCLKQHWSLWGAWSKLDKWDGKPAPDHFWALKIPQCFLGRNISSCSAFDHIPISVITSCVGWPVVFPALPYHIGKRCHSFSVLQDAWWASLVKSAPVYDGKYTLPWGKKTNNNGWKWFDVPVNR